MGGPFISQSKKIDRMIGYKIDTHVQIGSSQKNFKNFLKFF
jgi:hypothetical protein